MGDAVQTSPPLGGFRTILAIAGLLIAHWLQVHFTQMPPEMRGELGTALTGLVGDALQYAFGFLGMWFRFRANKTAIPRPRKRLPKVPPATVLALLAVWLAMGCAGTWPHGCVHSLGLVTCRAHNAAFLVSPHPDGLKRPAGRVQLYLDGEAIPLSIDATEIHGLAQVPST